MMISLYVYYRVEGDVPARASAARAMQAALAAAHGVQCRLKRRCDDGQTWMEEYHGIAEREAFAAALAQAVAAQPALAACARHQEWFVDLA